MKYLNGAIQKYLNELSAKTPAPGGGSAAALSLAMAASLAVMTIRFTLGKEKYRKWESLLKKDLKGALAIQKRAASLIDADATAYQNKDFKKALRVPAEVAHLSDKLMELACGLISYGNKNLKNDTVMAALLAEVSLVSGLMNVEANREFLKKESTSDKKLLWQLRFLYKKIKKRRRLEACLGDSFRR